MNFTVDWSKAAEEVIIRGDSTSCVRGRRQHLQVSPPAVHNMVLLNAEGKREGCMGGC